MAGYIGTQPVPQATQTRDAFTCTAGQTSFATSGYTPGYLDVYLNGIKLAAADYTASNGSDVVLASGAALDDILEVVAYTSFEITNVTGADDFTVTGGFTSRGIDDNATSTAMTLDTSGNLLVRTTTPEIRGQSTIEGLAYRTGNSLDVATTSGLTANFNRMSTDGDIVAFRKDGTIVGSIGTDGSHIYVGSTDVGLRFRDAADQIQPYSTSGSARDAAIDLGAAGVRFKDLFLSGGVYLGGTGAANKLDDYETGTFTVNLEFDTNSGTISYGSKTGRYHKIGHMVFVEIRIRLTSLSGHSGNAKITGLPFSTGQYSGYKNIPMPLKMNGYTNNRDFGFAVKTDNNSILRLHLHQDGSEPFDIADSSNFSGNEYFTISGQYETVS